MLFDVKYAVIHISGIYASHYGIWSYRFTIWNLDKKVTAIKMQIIKRSMDMRRFKRGKYLFAGLLFLAFVVVLLLNLKQENELENINDYTPIALLEDSIVYDYIKDDGALVIGCYDIASKRQSDIMCEDEFYISSGLPGIIGNSVILPITLNTNEHELLMIDADSDTSEVLVNEFNPYPIDAVSIINTDIYMLSSMGDDSTVTTCIRKYNENTDNMDICIRKGLTDNTGEQIVAFDCNNEKIYVTVKQIETGDDTHIEIYDDQNYDLLGKLYFDRELYDLVSANDIVQFYCFGDYVYIRNYSDYGAIGKIENGQVKTILSLPDLRIAYNGGNTQDNYYGFFVRSDRDFYLLDVYADTLYQTNLGLSQDESVRNAISNGNDICISVLDERATEAFITKDTIIVGFDELKNNAYQIKNYLK